MEAEDVFKTYPEDEFVYEDWQLVDFMKKLGLPYPIDDKGNLTGQAFKLWTSELRLSVVENDVPNMSSITPEPESKPKSWWKFW
jgi:hypothetical protein